MPNGVSVSGSTRFWSSPLIFTRTSSTCQRRRLRFQPLPASCGYRQRTAGQNGSTKTSPSHGRCRCRVHAAGPPHSSMTGGVANVQHHRQADHFRRRIEIAKRIGFGARHPRSLPGRLRQFALTEPQKVLSRRMDLLPKVASRICPPPETRTCKIVPGAKLKFARSKAKP